VINTGRKRGISGGEGQGQNIATYTGDVCSKRENQRRQWKVEFQRGGRVLSSPTRVKNAKNVGGGERWEKV